MGTPDFIKSVTASTAYPSAAGSPGPFDKKIPAGLCFNASAADVVAGTIWMGVMNLPVALPLIKDGRLRAIAVTSKEPVASLPGVKTLNTLGPEFVISGWAALFAARNVPAAAVERFAAQLRTALQQESVRERFDGFGVTPEFATPAQTRDYVAAEMARWADVVKSRGIKLE